jgi:hypothetical protein
MYNGNGMMRLPHLFFCVGFIENKLAKKSPVDESFFSLTHIEKNYELIF